MVEWPPDHPRNMRLLGAVQFFDKRGVEWVAMRGDVIDGASTGWLLRRLLPAYVGFYRRASVLHDCYCESKTRPSWQVHRMFREAMLTDGITIASRGRNRWTRAAMMYVYYVQSWIMWLAVRLFGPRF